MIIFLAGLLQGICLVALPAASTIITSPHEFAFSSTAYGSLFIPQSLLAITTSAFNPHLSKMFSLKKVFQFGITANLISMLLLALSALFMNHFTTSYALLFTAAGMLGLGFGLCVPTLNEMVTLFYPAKINSMLLILNALLGVGTALAPVLIMLFIGLGFWWGLPVTLVFLLSVLLLMSLKWSFKEEPIKKIFVDAKIPQRFWIFAACALLYGIIETLNGNWIGIYMGSNQLAGSLALTAFWGMVTFGRVFFALIDKVFKEETAFQIAPFISTVAFIIIGFLPKGVDNLAIITFGLMGFSCSVMLPLIISFGAKQLKTIASSIPGMIISCYLLGYGIAAFGVGPLQEKMGISLQGIYLMGGIIAFCLGIIAVVIQNFRFRATR